MVEELQNNQQIIKALVYGLIFLVFCVLGLILFFYFSRRKIIQKEVEKVNIKLDYQKEILQHTINVQEEERKRIAQDLHDVISSKLNVVSLTANVLIEDNSLANAHKDALNHILEITTSTLKSSRKIAHELLPPTLANFGLKVTLEELFDEFTSNSTLLIDHHIEELNYIDSIHQLHVFRITQELINNALTHGQATKLDIILKKENDGFIFIFKDNGKGFDSNRQSKKSGLGLQNIKSRAAILNANVHIESSEKIGSIFTINSKLNAI